MYSVLLTQGQSMNLIDMILKSRGLILLDLIILIGFSILTWYAIVYKGIYYYKAFKSNKAFLDAFWSGGSLEQIYKVAEENPRSPISQVFIAGYKELARLKATTRENESGSSDLQNLERSLRKSAMVEIMRLEGMLPVMATISATAPFLGLFGTVWGIMASFSAIGMSGNTTLATVAPGIVDALITTALGLIAAIPATIAYNYFLRKVRLHVAEMETFANDFLNIAQRKFFQ
ncbi:MotA/TolQ/ExbB proton channel family protein [Myxococcota bacterium]|nr:MotA/TolQ/ExbB proton channel family protein [Myxococcota bacterium]MBU1382540.1 MotA/TolQ/ExbB proton channel family protein [Myxococcota bacterium]MBU1497432.1 MotA/TolQ/ExbB proton channel family protein [Myxococcota bacterium]